jgi:hypothetical protein
MELRVLGIGLEAIYVTFWHRMCLNFVHALKLSRGQSLKVMDWLIWQRKFEDCTTFRQWYG